MTYIEKLMSAIRFDDEKLTADEIKRLRIIISWKVCTKLCPANIKFLHGPDLGRDNCPVAGTCIKCWKMEAEEAAVNE